MELFLRISTHVKLIELGYVRNSSSSSFGFFLVDYVELIGRVSPKIKNKISELDLVSELDLDLFLLVYKAIEFF